MLTRRMARPACLLTLLVGGLGLIPGCDRDKASENLAPVASTPLEADRPSSPKAMDFSIDKAKSTLSFLMEAPVEKITGEAPEGVQGTLSVDLENLAKSTGLVRVDLDQMTLYQAKLDDETGKFKEKTRSDKQNRDARGWLEINEDAPPDIREKNRFVEYKITGLESPSVKNVMDMKGPERKVTATVVGDFRLHGRKLEKRAKVELTFRYDGEKPVGLSVKSLEPLPIGLEEFDVRPREAFGKLAKATLTTLGSKVAESAPILVELAAKPK